MKKMTAAVVLSWICCLSAGAQKDSTNQPINPQIRQYWFVLLTKGPQRSQDSAAAMKIQMGHLDNIRRLYNEGKIKVAGPFGEEGDWQGIFIFDCASKTEVEQLLRTDPAVKAGRLNYLVKPWYTAPIGSFIPGKPQNSIF